MELALIGPGHSKFCDSVGEVSLSLYLLPQAAAVLRLDWPDEEVKGIRELLTARRERHKGILNYSSIVGARAREIADCTVVACGMRDSRLASALRGTSVFDYVFSIYFMPGKLHESPHGLSTWEAALLEPGQMQLTDTFWEDPSSESELVVNLLTENLAYPNIEMGKTLRCRASWASVVVSGVVSPKTRDLYSALEVRTQALWLLAHRVSRLRPGEPPLDLHDLEVLSVLFEQLVSTHLLQEDPMVNERILRLNQGIVASSRVEKRIQIARDNLAGLRSIAQAQEVRRRSQFEFVAEVLLFLIASITLVPVVIPTPLVGNARVTAIGLWLLCLAAFVLMQRRRRF